MKSRLLFLLFAFVSLSFSDLTKKIISDKEYRYEFYTTTAKARVKEKRFYHWFKGGQLHQSQAGVSGELLDGAFQKFYLNNQLAESGALDNGLRTGIWKTWYPNGTLHTAESWWDGLKSGVSLTWDASGQLLEQGKFTKGEKRGMWINQATHDTLIYKDGKATPPKRKPTAAQKVLQKQTDSIARVQAKKQKQLEKQKAQDKKAQAGAQPNWFQRTGAFFKGLFQKKRNQGRCG